MPTYQYRCSECGQDLEAVQKFTDAALTECPNCGGSLRKVYNAVGVVFKGSGFYSTDSRSSNGKGSSSTSSESGSKDGASSNGNGDGSSSKPKTDGSSSKPKSDSSSNGKSSAPAAAAAS
jgi:putative FmdB family regulatory protein